MVSRFTEIISAADLGTNTIKITHASISDAGDITEIEEQTDTIRLGANLEVTGRIESARIEACISFLQASERRGKELGSRSFVGVATEAFRMADNGNTLLERIKDETAWDVRVIPGEVEARLTYVGLKDIVPVGGRTIIADIGGGSTEIIRIEEESVVSTASIQLGSGRLADRFFESDPPSIDVLSTAVDAAASQLGLSGDLPHTADHLLFSGGNGIFVKQLLRELHPDRSISASSLDDLLEHLSRSPAQETADRLLIAHERARVLPAGVAIARAFLQTVDVNFADGVPSGIRRGLLREYSSQQGLER